MSFYSHLGLIWYRPAGCDGLLAMYVSLSVGLCFLAIPAQRSSNAKSQPQWTPGISSQSIVTMYINADIFSKSKSNVVTLPAVATEIICLRD